MARSVAETTHPIRARSHLLTLLGEELIGDDRLAIFELVKNSYDADATEVAITMNLATHEPKIIVEDSGVGMTLDDLTNKWLELATDSRRRNASLRSKRFHRLPLGEKGVGRIAVFKLGRNVTLTTRAQHSAEYELHIDWDELVKQGEYLDDLRVEILENKDPKQQVFTERLELRPALKSPVNQILRAAQLDRRVRHRSSARRLAISHSRSRPLPAPQCHGRPGLQ